MLSSFGHNPFAFVVLSGMVFFAWGEIYSLFPATCADAYGRLRRRQRGPALHRQRHRLAPGAAVSMLASGRGGWHPVFLIASAINFAAALMALFVLKPLRARMGRTRVVAS